MLFTLTSLAVLLGMAVSLWLAAYLLARGFNSPVTLRAVVILAALVAYFLSTYLNLYYPSGSGSVWRTAFLTAGLVVWHDLIDCLVPRPVRRRRLNVWLIYGLGALAVALLLLMHDLFASPSAGGLATARVRPGLTFIWFGLFEAVVVGAIFYNFYLIRQSGGGPHHRYFFVSTVAAAVTVLGFAFIALAGNPSVPHLAQDGLLLIAVGFFGYAVARHQAFVERQTTLQDFPVVGLTVVGLAGVYALLARRLGFTPEAVALVTVLAVLTHSSVDLAREFLDRLLHRRAGAMREHLRRLARGGGGEEALQHSLQRGLGLLCQRLNALGGFIALRQDGDYDVRATVHSFPLGSRIADAACEDLSQPSPALLPQVAWLAPAMAGDEQVAVVGLGAPRSARVKYSAAELDTLAEVADWVGLLVALHRQQLAAGERLARLAEETEAHEAGDLQAVLGSQAEREYVGQVEEALRRLADYTALGGSPLVARLRLEGGTHVERGKAVRQQLVRAIEALRPPGARPAEPLPREWYSFAILYDAYVEDVPNREIMARLYISHGTFNRVRRKALRAVARNLLEMEAGAGA